MVMSGNYCEFTRADAKGTGSAVRVNFEPCVHGFEGRFLFTIASQKTYSSSLDADGNPIAPTYWWDASLTVRLDKREMSQMLQVLRGMRESINDGKGLFHRSANANAVIKFVHQIDPAPGYLMSVSRKDIKSGEVVSRFFFFDCDDALALMLGCEQKFGQMMFG